MMNIIERTQYSIDGGKTWGNTEQDARGLSASKALDELLGRDWAYHVMKAVRKHPDALITALRDMGALPEVNEDWTAYIHSDVGAAFRRGSEQAIEHAVTSEDGIEYNGQRYAVVPAEQHEKEEAALETIKRWARDGSLAHVYIAAKSFCVKHKVDREND